MAKKIFFFLSDVLCKTILIISRMLFLSKVDILGAKGHVDAAPETRSRKLPTYSFSYGKHPHSKKTSLEPKRPLS